MAVRFKLDLVGIKVSLRQWSRLGLEDRLELLQAYCGRKEEVSRLRQRLIDLITLREGGPIVELPIEPAPDWGESNSTPAAVREQARALGLRAPTDEEWAALTDLQRFALVKLSRSGHDNVNFSPALREFGLEAQPA
jgi:hypothetical protein